MPILADEGARVSDTYDARTYAMTWMKPPRDGHSFILVGKDGRIRWRADYGGPPKYTMFLPVDAIVTDLMKRTGKLSEVTLLTKEDCEFCEQAKGVLARLSGEYDLRVREVALESEEGRRLAGEAAAPFPPVVFLRGMRDPVARYFGELQAEVMEIFWQRESATVREAVDELNKRHKLAYTTVLTMITRLWSRGLLTRVSEGRGFRYRAAKTRDQFLGEFSDELIDRLIDDFGEIAVARLGDRLNKLGARPKTRLRQARKRL